MTRREHKAPRKGNASQSLLRGGRGAYTISCPQDWRSINTSPHGWPHSHASACGLHDIRRPVSTSKAGPSRHGVHLQDAAAYDAIGEHVVVVVIPFAGSARLSLLWPPQPWRISSRRLAEPFLWSELRRPSAVSDRSRRLEASSPVRSFPSPHSPPSSGKGLARSIQGQSE